MSGYRYLDPTALASVKNLSLVARGVVEGSITGLHASPYKGFSVEFAEHREYVPGDDPRHLDYTMLARTERLYIKQYEEETNMRVRILLDASASMNYSSGNRLTKFSYGAHLAATLAYLMTRQQDAVGLTVFDTAIRLDCPSRSSPQHFHEMMEQLETIQPAHQTQVAEVLNLLADRFKKRNLIVLISDLYDDPELVLRSLCHFRYRKHELIVFHVLDRSELEFPFDESMAFYDLETNERMKIDPTAVRGGYLEAMGEFLAKYKSGCAEQNIDYVAVDTSIPYDFMLSRYLNKRSRL
ncbi:MAG: DUF58 domain-containing protein [Thermoguttaceae bacterium]|nr:DUF58 domain-containing protein [Thermoguttaceae bacterium]